MTQIDDNPELNKTNKNDTTKKKNVNNDEIWALLNYSKVRLATGTTPEEEEAKAMVGLLMDDANANANDHDDFDGGDKGLDGNKKNGIS
jgi:hypothetical protein